MMMSVRRSGTIPGGVVAAGVVGFGGLVPGSTAFFRVRRILAEQWGQITETIFGTRSNSNCCLHFGQTAGVILGFEDDICTKVGNA